MKEHTEQTKKTKELFNTSELTYDAIIEFEKNEEKRKNKTKPIKRRMKHGK